jgi:alkanesulfonate monooxygenase SsuD/methylene tetrahydromethanopterin reductase-like flavin-dependent oxidoreductase (luciferase family)
MRFSSLLTHRLAGAAGQAVIDHTLDCAAVGFDAIFVPDGGDHLVATAPDVCVAFSAQSATGQRLDIVDRLLAEHPGDDPVRLAFGQRLGGGDAGNRAAADARPPLMHVAAHPESIERAAAEGIPVFLPGFTSPGFADGDPYSHVARHLSAYLDAMWANGQPAATIERCLDWTTVTYQLVHVAESDEQAAEEVEIIFGRQPAQWRDTWCLHGSPETVADQIQAYADIGIGNLLGSFTGAPLTEERTRLGRQSLDLFARHVMPRFRSATPSSDRARAVLGP